MQSNKKREQFAISIRRKQVTQKLETLRSQYQLQSQSESPEHYQKYLPLIAELRAGQKRVEDYLKQLKILSYSPQPAKLLHSSQIHHLLYTYLLTSTTPKQPQSSSTSSSPPPPLSTHTYTSILTILINLCVHIDLDIPPQPMQQIALNILVPEHEIISLWLIANIMYQRSMFGAAMARELVEGCQVLEYMEGRVGRKFLGDGDIVIFCYFCCGFLVVAGSLQPAHIRRIFNTIAQILLFPQKQQQCYFYLTEALIDHSPFLASTDYQLFTCQPIMKKLKHSCKNRKSRYIKNYLKMLINYVKSDKERAYEKMIQFGIFGCLSYCVENRLPEVKGLCGELGTVLLEGFGERIDIENIVFFGNLMLELNSIEKYPQDTQISLLKYSTLFLQTTLSTLPTSSSKQKFLHTFLQSSTLSQTIKAVLHNPTHNPQLLMAGLQFWHVLIGIDEKGLVLRKLAEEGVRGYLRQIGLGEGEGKVMGEKVQGLAGKFLGLFEECYGDGSKMM